MYLGKVVGCVTSTAKDNRLRGHRLLVVQPMSPEMKPNGKTIVCTDATGAGAGETVYWVRGKEAAIAFKSGDLPTDTTIVGIVDQINLKES
jgi:microcompartment protein CcmK/EutM